MKGCYISDVTDPDDELESRRRVGIFSVFPSGTHVNDVEVQRKGNTVIFTGKLRSLGNAFDSMSPNRHANVVQQT